MACGGLQGGVSTCSPLARQAGGFGQAARDAKWMLPVEMMAATHTEKWFGLQTNSQPSTRGRKIESLGIGNKQRSSYASHPCVKGFLAGRGPHMGGSLPLATQFHWEGGRRGRMDATTGTPWAI